VRTPQTANTESWIRRESPTGNPLTKFVNLLQSPEERRDKYNYCRFFGLPYYVAMRLRDWHWTKINLYIGAYGKEPQEPLPIIAPSV
jgi:hypothetical protein